MTYDGLADVPAAESIDWSKTGSFIAVGYISAAVGEARIYEHNIDDGTVTQRAVSPELNETVWSVHLNSDATGLAIGTDIAAASEEVRIYNFNTSTYDFSLDTVHELSTVVRAVRWSNDDKFLISGDDATNLTVYSYSPDEAFVTDGAVFEDVELFFPGDVSWYATTTFIDHGHIKSDNHHIVLEDGGAIVAGAGAHLTIENAEIYGISGSNLRCEDDTSIIELKGCTLRLDSDYSFSLGRFLFKQEVVITGTHKFIYDSRMGSTIDVNGVLMIDPGTTFSYAPPGNNRDLLYMTDKSSLLYLNGCTLYSTATGMRLTRGSLFLDNDVTFSCAGTNPSESIAFGDGTSDGDLDVTWLSGAYLTVHGGLYDANSV